ncbi:EamA family transporter [Leucobacter chromiireducens]|nr:EamA family transporter [Leucobacter chromiireducens]
MSSSSTAQHFTRSATIRAMLLVLVGSLGMQFSAVIAVGLFPAFGVLGTSALRMVIAAVILLAIFRPRLRGRTRREWVGIILYGVAMAAMNAFLYLAFSRLPLGIATTIDFLGPCMVALLASRRAREGALAVVALLGVALIAGFGGALDPLGLLFAALAGTAFGLYTLLAAQVGQSDGGLPSVALSVTVAAILTLPFSVPVMPLVRPEHLLALLTSAVLGTALAFTVDTIAGKLTSARVLGVLFAFDPVVGTILGALFLNQLLTPIAVLGIVLVVGAGAGIVWLSGGHGPAAAPAPEPEPEPGPASEPTPTLAPEPAPAEDPPPTA